MASPFLIFDQQIVEVLAKSIVTYWTNCHHDHAESASLPPEMVQSALKEIRHRRGIQDEDVVSDTEILQRARQKALQIWKENRPTQASIAVEPQHLNVAKSVSLFVSSGGSALDGFLTFELIRERATDSHDILRMLSKIQYIDDVIPDWDDIAPFLRSELSAWLSNAKGSETIPSFGLDFISLHRQWFDMTRKGIHSSQDYRMIQVSLAQSLIEAVHCVDSLEQRARDRHLDFYKKCLCTILDMFCDWMDRNIGGSSDRDPAIREIGMVLWDWSTAMSTRMDDRSNILRQHCPHGQWIYQWFAQCFTVRELVSLLERSATDPNGPSKSGKPWNTLYCIVHEATFWINVIRKIDCEDASNIESNRLLHGDTTDRRISSPNIKEIDGVYSFRNLAWILSTIRSILCVLRVSHFPWYLLKYSTSCEPCEQLTMDLHEYHMQLWEMFWQLFHWIQQKRVTSVEAPVDMNSYCVICTDAMEVLLLGVSSTTQAIILFSMIEGDKLAFLQRFRHRNCHYL